MKRFWTSTWNIIINNTKEYVLKRFQKDVRNMYFKKSVYFMDLKKIVDKKNWKNIAYQRFGNVLKKLFEKDFENYSQGFVVFLAIFMKKFVQWKLITN